MKNILYLLLLAVALPASVFAQDQDNRITEVTFTVKGVCDMCKNKIEKAAMYTKGVKSAAWNIDKQLVTVIFRNDKTTQEAIEKSIANAGYDTQNVKATDEAYESLHHCCRYRDLDKH